MIKKYEFNPISKNTSQDPDNVCFGKNSRTNSSAVEKAG